MYIYIYTHIYTYTHTHIHTHMCTCMYIYICIYIHIMFIAYILTMCIYTYIYICIYIYTYSRGSRQSAYPWRMPCSSAQMVWVFVHTHGGRFAQSRFRLSVAEMKTCNCPKGLCWTDRKVQVRQLPYSLSLYINMFELGNRHACEAMSAQVCLQLHLVFATSVRSVLEAARSRH